MLITLNLIDFFLNFLKLYAYIFISIYPLCVSLLSPSYSLFVKTYIYRMKEKELEKELAMKQEKENQLKQAEEVFKLNKKTSILEEVLESAAKV